MIWRRRANKAKQYAKLPGSSIDTLIDRQFTWCGESYSFLKVAFKLKLI